MTATDIDSRGNGRSAIAPRAVRPLAQLLACALLVPAIAAAQPLTENAVIATLREEAQSYERGLGVAPDPARAAALYCQAARLGDSKSQFDLGWMYANGLGVERSDATAAFFFQVAADQGVEPAANMLRVVGGPPKEPPACMRARNAPRADLVAKALAPVARDTPIQAPPTIAELVKQVAPEYRVPPTLVLAIMEAESNFNYAALSPKNAQGLMQLIPETQQRFQVRNGFDPVQNVRGGMAYLRWLLAYFEGDVALVAAAYNAGERAVERYRGVPPYLETRMYVRRIVAAVGPAAAPFDASVVAPSPYLPLMRERPPSRIR
jgi:soluble lytic murein transglycosylase-like protein